MSLVPYPAKQETSPKPGEGESPAMVKARRVSYWFLVGILVLVGWFKLGTPFLALLFSYYVLDQLRFLKRNWLKVAIFLTFVTLVCFGLAYFLDQAIRNLPQVGEKAVPGLIQFAKAHEVELPFSDWESLKEFAMDSVQSELRLVGTFARFATKEFVLLIIGIAIATSLFLNPLSKFFRREGDTSENIYTLYSSAIAARFRSFYESFAKVMGAQLIISTINTGLTALFIVSVGMPYAAVGIGVTFLCGLLPIAGNLISNTILVAIGFTVSPKMALWALIFLVTLHKLEYFLNSKIIGRQIKNPVWLTLIGLIVGERLMGVTGMILAPVILHFIRMQASQFKVQTGTPAGGQD